MGAAFCASPSFPIPLSKAQPWLRRLRQERMHELTDHISQIIFNDVELTADILSTLKTNMRYGRHSMDRACTSQKNRKNVLFIVIDDMRMQV